MLLLDMSCKIMCWKLADLTACLVFIRSLSPWYLSSLSENKTGAIGSQGNLERKALTVTHLNQIWWPGQNPERLMTCHPTSWEAPGHHNPLPASTLLRVNISCSLLYPNRATSKEAQLHRQHAGREGRATAWLLPAILHPGQPAFSRGDWYYRHKKGQLSLDILAGNCSMAAVYKRSHSVSETWTNKLHMRQALQRSTRLDPGHHLPLLGPNYITYRNWIVFAAGTAQFVMS